MISDYITIPLSKTGKYAGLYEAIVDIEDADLAEWNWHARVVSETLIYAQRYVYIKGVRHHKHLHHIILSRKLNESLPDDSMVDHANGNPLDNRRKNLRVATSAQNQANQKMNVLNTSGRKGVTWDKSRQKWQAKIQVNYKTIHLGRFTSLDLAYQAYCDAADKYFKKFANYGE